MRALAAVVLTLAVFVPTESGQVSATVVFVGDSNLVRASTQLIETLSAPEVGAVPTFAARSGARVYWNGCWYFSPCYTPGDLQYWAHRLGALPTPDVWVVNLGVNDALTAGSATTGGYSWYNQKIDYILGLARGRPVIWTNLPCGIYPPEYQTGCAIINQALWNAQPRWPNLRFANWRTVAELHPEWVDGTVHLTTAGYAAYAALIKDELGQL